MILIDSWEGRFDTLSLRGSYAPVDCEGSARLWFSTYSRIA